MSAITSDSRSRRGLKCSTRRAWSCSTSGTAKTLHPSNTTGSSGMGPDPFWQTAPWLARALSLIRQRSVGFTGSWPTLAKPTLANRLWPALLADRVWPNRLLPALVFLWHGRLWPKPTLANRLCLAKPTLAKTSLTCCVWCGVCVWCVVYVCVCVLCGVGACFTVSWSGGSRVGVGFKVLVRSRSVPPDSPSRDRPKFRSFSLSLRKIRSFLPSLGVFS